MVFDDKGVQVLKSNRGLHAALFLGAATLPVLSISTAARAADQSVETVVVTGSMLKQTDLNTSSPLTVLSRDSIDSKGLTSTADIIRSLTSDSSGTIPTAFGAGFAAGSSGVALRGLSVNSTLVLINGRRTANYPLADDGERGFVDLNTIPMDVIDQVQVLKDGASSSYGADAIGGVINIILKNEFQGAEGTVEAGTSQHGGGLTKRITGTVGWGTLATDHYNVYFNAEYEDDQHIKVGDRSFPYNTVDLSSIGGTNGQGSTSIYGKATPSYMGNEADPTSGGSALGNSVVLATAGCGPLGVLHNTSSGAYCSQNAALYGDDQPKETRYGFYGHGVFQINAHTQAYIDASFFGNDVTVDGAPPAARTTTPHNTTAIALPAYLLNGTLNPNDPFAVAGCHGANNPTGTGPQCVDASIFYRFGDIPHWSTYSNRVIRATAGVKGDLWGWDYDFGVVAAHSELTSSLYGYLSYTDLLAAIENGTYNFRDPSQNSAAIRAQIAPPNIKKSTTDLDSIDLHVNRDVFDLPAGAVQIGLGVEARHEGTFDPDLNPLGNTQGLGKAHTIGSRSVYSAFGEANIPLFKDTIAGTGSVDVSGRYDHYSDFGDSWVPKVAAKWQVLPQIMFRGTWSRGFRAPSFSENGSAAATGFVTLDPSSYSTTFATAHGNSDYSLPYAFAENTTSNPAIKPETSRNYNVGTVITPLSDQILTITVDYYNIKKKNVIQAADPSDAILAAFAGTPIPTGFAISYDNPDPLHPSAPLRPVSVSAPYINANSITTDGIDVAILAGFGITDELNYSTDLEVTQILSYKADTGSGVDEYVGLQSSYNMSSGAGTPRWRGSWSHTFTYDVTSLTATINMVSGEKEYGLDAGSARDPVTGVYSGCLDSSGIHNCSYGDFWTLDLTANHKLTDNIKVFAGIKNLLDAKAPLDPANYAGTNYNPTYAQSGIVGRFFTFGVTLKD